jgi:hypothetical protein
LCDGEARKDVHTETFGLLRQPRSELPERDDEVAVIVHGRKVHGPARQLQRTGARHQPHVVLDRGDFHAWVIGAPIRQQFLQRRRFEHRTGEGMRADGGAFLQDADGHVGLELLQANGAREPRRAGADDHHLILHRVAFDLGHDWL